VERPTLIYALVVFGVIAAAILRACLAKRRRWEGFFKSLGFVEIGVLALLLAGLVFFGCLQIVLRNFFQRGIIWADPLMRHMVLWIGCLGGALATCKMRHIGIDALTRFLPRRAKAVRDRIVYLATAVASFSLGIAALKFVLDEKDFGGTSFLDVETWKLEAILPIAFLLIAYRSVVNTIRPPETKPVEWENEEAAEESGP
jgi:TRAP-type C4-dicarboxylate transport system permease small subunit